MNGFDLAILAAAAAAAFGGFRLGFVKRSLGWLGAAAGLGLAFAVLPAVLEWSDGDDEPRLVLISAAVLFAGVLIGQLVGLLIASSFRLSLPPPLRVADRVVGALLGAVIILLGVWLLLPVMKAIPTWPRDQADSSAIAGAIDDTLPEAPDALEGLREVVEELAIPTVFSDPADAPTVTSPPTGSPLSAATADALAASVVRVSGVACGFIQQGSGFVVEAGLVATNAHVVAGHEFTEVEIPGLGSSVGQIVFFDPATDLALIAVPDLSAPPLSLVEPIEGEEGVVAGYTGGGSLELSPYAFAERVRARGTDIYSRDEVERDVLVLATELAPGDSGSPVVNAEGAVVGMAFAVDPGREGVGYALSELELRSALAESREPTGAGSCVARG